MLFSEIRAERTHVGLASACLGNLVSITALNKSFARDKPTYVLPGNAVDVDVVGVLLCGRSGLLD